MHLAPLIIILASLATTSHGDANPNLITIKGLNLDSSIQEIESILGECTKSAEPEGTFLCPTEENDDFPSSYSLNEIGQVTSISFQCQLINGCEYSMADLADLLSESLSLSSPIPFLPNVMTVDGPGGDRLLVLGREQTTVVIAYIYSKPLLDLN
jgi:hypothetical protein